jgi:hypothetical protein
MQGISRIQPSFAKICLESISEFRCLWMNSLRRQSREFFCQRREFFCRAGNEQGIRRKTDPRGKTHPMTSEARRSTLGVVSARLERAAARSSGPKDPSYLIARRTVSIPVNATWNPIQKSRKAMSRPNTRLPFSPKNLMIP